MNVLPKNLYFAISYTNFTRRKTIMIFDFSMPNDCLWVIVNQSCIFICIRSIKYKSNNSFNFTSIGANITSIHTRTANKGETDYHLQRNFLFLWRKLLYVIIHGQRCIYLCIWLFETNFILTFFFKTLFTLLFTKSV